jgi:hypothetical protein
MFAPAAWASAPSELVRDQIQRHNSDIVLSHEAALRAGTPATFMYARQAEAVHKAARARLTRLGARMGLGATDEITPESAQELRLLSMLVGREFDVEYLRYMAKDQALQIRDLTGYAGARDEPIFQVARAEIPRIRYGVDRAKILESREKGEPGE